MQKLDQSSNQPQIKERNLLNEVEMSEEGNITFTDMKIEDEENHNKSDLESSDQ